MPHTALTTHRPEIPILTGWRPGFHCRVRVPAWRWEEEPVKKRPATLTALCTGRPGWQAGRPSHLGRRWDAPQSNRCHLHCCISFAVHSLHFSAPLFLLWEVMEEIPPQKEHRPQGHTACTPPLCLCGNRPPAVKPQPGIPSPQPVGEAVLPLCTSSLGGDGRGGANGGAIHTWAALSLPDGAPWLKKSLRRYTCTHHLFLHLSQSLRPTHLFPVNGSG